MRFIRVKRRNRLIFTITALSLLSFIILQKLNEDRKTKEFEFQLPTGKTKYSAFIAAILYQNEQILPQFIENLFTIIPYFGPNVFISIYENGSTDRTKEILLGLKQLLSKSSIPHRIIIDDKLGREFFSRIHYMASLRNKVLEPFFSQSNISARFYDRLVFFNDILYDPQDFLGMVYGKKSGVRGGGNDEYDAICGLDYSYNFYDIFATREFEFRSAVDVAEDNTGEFGTIKKEWILNTDRREKWVGGFQPASNWPIFYDSDRQHLMRQQNSRVPVFSCWNGVAVFNTKPFYEHVSFYCTDFDVEFTLRTKKLKFRALPQEGGEYTASECCLIFSDLYSLGYRRVFIDPTFIARYESVSVIQWFVFYWSKFRACQLFYTPVIESGKLQHAHKMQKIALNQGVSPLDITCIQ